MAHVLWSTEVVGAEHVPVDGPVLLAANHTGVIDGPLLMAAAPRPSHVLVKAEAFRGPVGAVLRGAGQIPVDRDSGRGALQAALGVLRRGGVVGVFPEGNRGRGDAAAARAGVAWLALRAHAPVVPVAVLGTRRTGEGVGHVPRLRRRCVVEFGQPIVLEPAAGMTGKVATEAANDAIRVALADLVASASARTGLTLPGDGPVVADAPGMD
ncbi:1-acyl-sn-glycerol-3-phosphate acyltransferase [mine drainage metagenome]|uniref:1-acyl-sn-glycerol-3-phosphate acyltransferase n=1 Tax=mine drainage metagenome TaxID=410659 RepID=A0A1J5QLR6_9ZZZZ